MLGGIAHGVGAARPATPLVTRRVIPLATRRVTPLAIRRAIARAARVGMSAGDGARFAVWYSVVIVGTVAGVAATRATRILVAVRRWRAALRRRSPRPRPSRL